MDANAERLEFTPPHEPAAIRAFGMAVLAHLLLAGALTWGINWKKDNETVSAEAELWAAVPQQAPPAPIVVQQTIVTPPTPVTPPAPEPKVETPPPVVAEPDIALEREKRKQEIAQRRAAELALERKKQKLEALEREKRELIAQQKAEQKAATKAAERAAEKASQDKQRKDELAKSKANEAKIAALRDQNMDRMRKLAGADPSATGDTNGGPSRNKGPTTRNGAPTAAYASRIAARIRPYIRHPQEVPGNPPVEIEVKTSPDGTIVDQRVTKSSGNTAWDESAIRAVIAATTLPRNEEGRVISPITIVLRFRDQ